MKSEILKIYNERYGIPRQDLADAGESNRIVGNIISSSLFLLGIVDFIAIVLTHHSDLQNQLTYLVYFGIFMIPGIFTFLYSKCIKNVPNEKSYILKTIPVYIIIYMSLFISVYNFYILGKPFNGVVIYFMTSFISLCVFSFSPVIFLFGIVIAIGVMTPGIYAQFQLSGLADSILATFLMFCLALYKRRIEKKHILLLKKQKHSLEAKTFGNFTLLYENKVIKFSRTKSNELIAYLVYKNGSSVNTKELIAVLWGDQANSSKHGSNLRNLIVDIKHTLSKMEILNFFIAEYNNFRINPSVINCDYYDFLSGDKNAMDSFAGEFMSQFSWAEETAGFLEQKAIRKI
ncbi:hypothetical protein [uncultured Treponema sp.]|uniref:hypothetical protein n=1 Tax=uncultured Treponema sp. TaxID=162155 RepID=UPI0025E77F56|nr:hypothetical protein [uncultured Treponema sp.]